MKMNCGCEVVKEFSDYHKKTVELVGFLRREFEYRAEHGELCNPDTYLQKMIEDFIRETEET
jgi:hypothetical protein